LKDFVCKEGKTAETVKFFEKIGAKRNVLLVVSVKDELVERATRNLENVVVSQAMYLNVFNIMNADTIVITEKSLQIINEWLVKEEGAKK
jgi:large subunit ribosomal protein L4